MDAQDKKIHDETLARVSGSNSRAREMLARADERIEELESSNAELRAVVAVHEETIAELRRNRATLDADLNATAKYADELRTMIANQAVRIYELEGATNHAGGLHAPR
jgi:hypothetical protein